MSEPKRDESHPLFSHKTLRNIVFVKGTISNPDTHVIRETLQFKDGIAINQVRVVENLKRSFYITKPQYRTYTQHKEREALSRLMKFESTETDLPYNIMRELGIRRGYGTLRQACDSPYVFGAMSPSTSLVRKYYKNTWPQIPTPLKYMAYDLETCVFDKDGSIIIASIAIDEIVEVYIRKDFLAGIDDPLPKIKSLVPVLAQKYNYEKYLAECSIEFEILDTELDIIKRLADAMHHYDTDVVAAWNHHFDVNKIINRCNSLGVNPADIFSHPNVPNCSRRFIFEEGKTKMITDSGVEKRLQSSEQWHNVLATTGFVWLDAMCTYRRLRTQNQFLPSYSLDAISKLHLSVGKLHTDETEHMTSLDRHKYMQSKDKLTYCVYAALDVRLMVLLERITKDITVRLPLELAGSDFRDTANSSKRTIDMFAEAVEKDGYVLGTIGTEPDKMPEPVLPISFWPVVLPLDLNIRPGITCLKDYPSMPTNIHTCCFTTDLVSAYPTIIACGNIAKETTKYEFVRIVGANCGPTEILTQNLNLFGGRVNALDYCINMLGYKTLDQVDELIADLI